MDNLKKFAAGITFAHTTCERLNQDSESILSKEIAMSTTTTPTAVASMPGIGSQFIPTSTSSTSSNSMNEQSFLTLFLAQLQNQDPTSPMQSYELASQLAQFTTVEQLSQATTNLGDIQQYSANLNNGQITSLVAKR